MIALISIAGAVAVAGLASRFASEDRPFFNEEPESPRDRRAWI